MRRRNAGNIMSITDPHRRIARVLFNWIRTNRLTPDTISYGELAIRAGIGTEYIGFYLGGLSRESNYLEHLLITSIVTYAGTNTPADQFYIMAISAGRADINPANIDQEQQRVFAQDWSAFETHLDTHENFQHQPPIRI